VLAPTPRVDGARAGGVLVRGVLVGVGRVALSQYLAAFLAACQ